MQHPNLFGEIFLTPKELAHKEQVSLNAVYYWMRKGMPFIRRGKLGSIFIELHQYVNWMTESAKSIQKGESPVANDVPRWILDAVKAHWSEYA